GRTVAIWGRAVGETISQRILSPNDGFTWTNSSFSKYKSKQSAVKDVCRSYWMRAAIERPNGVADISTADGVMSFRILVKASDITKSFIKSFSSTSNKINSSAP